MVGVINMNRPTRFVCASPIPCLVIGCLFLLLIIFMFSCIFQRVFYFKSLVYIFLLLHLSPPNPVSVAENLPPYFISLVRGCKTVLQILSPLPHRHKFKLSSFYIYWVCSLSLSHIIILYLDFCSWLWFLRDDPFL